MNKLLIPLLLLGLTANAYQATDSLKQDKLQQEVSQYLELCWSYRFNKPDSAKFYGLKALELARQHKHRELEADALQNIAVVYESQGELSEALENNLKALQIFEGLDNPLKLANIQNNLGIVYDQLGNYAKAITYYKNAYNLYKEIDDKENLAMVGINLGIVFKAQGDYAQAIDAYRDANKIYRSIPSAEGIAYSEANLGSVFYFTKQYDSCVYYSLKAEEAFKKQNNLQFLPVVQCNAGMGLFEMGNQQKAKELLEKALDQHRSFQNKREISFVLIQLSRVYLKQKSYEKAEQGLNEAITLATSINSPQQVMDASKILSEYYAERKDFRNAYQHHIKYSNVKDSLFEKNKTKMIADFRIQYDTEKKEQEIALLSSEAAIQELKLNQRTLFLFVALLVILLGTIAVFSILKHRKLQSDISLQQAIHQQQQQLANEVFKAEERERRRIASDLHDGVGQLLSAAMMHLKEAHHRMSGATTNDVIAEKGLSLLEESYAEMRNISHQMMPSALVKAGLPVALKEFFHKMEHPELKIYFEASGIDGNLDEQTETILYRIVQETVNNVIKHANATEITIQLSKDETGIDLTIEDNGQGFDTRKLEAAKGIGMKNIAFRLSLLKGSYEVDSSPGKGTLMAIHLPAA